MRAVWANELRAERTKQTTNRRGFIETSSKRRTDPLQCEADCGRRAARFLFFISVAGQTQAGRSMICFPTAGGFIRAGREESTPAAGDPNRPPPLDRSRRGRVRGGAAGADR